MSGDISDLPACVAASLIATSRRENRTVTEYPDSLDDACALLESLGVYASDTCPVWEHHSGSGHSGPEAVGHYMVWADDWQVCVVTAEVSP